jgi:hypothetical protein
MIFTKPMTAPQQVEFGGPLESAISPPRRSRRRTVCLPYTLGGGEVPPWNADRVLFSMGLINLGSSEVVIRTLPAQRRLF